MAYYLHHTLEFNSRQIEQIVIHLYKKDDEPVSVVPLTCTGFSVSYLNGAGDKFDSIISCEAKVGFWIEQSSPVSFTDFIVSFHDEWKLVAYSDAQIVFTGFLVPGEGEAAFLDKPYELSLVATDGLGYLKEETVSGYTDEPFKGYITLDEVIRTSLAKTGLDLPIRVYSNIFESAMVNRNFNPTQDFFQQTRVNFRTFQKNPTEYISCWDALDKILKQGFSLYQWNGQWVINRVAEMQESIGPVRDYTNYADRITILSGTDSNLNAEVGRQKKLHPVGAGQIISSNFAVKSVTTQYEYTVWPELPLNNKFERGTFLLPLSGPDFSSYTIDDWTFGNSNINTGIPYPLTPVASPAYSKRSFNVFGVEVKREIIVPTPPFNGSLSNHNWLRSEPIPVNEGDKIEIGFQVRTAKDFTANGNGPFKSTGIFGQCYIISLDGTKVAVLNGDGSYAATWKDHFDYTFGGIGLSVRFVEDTTKSTSFNTTSDPFPFDGTMYIVLDVPDADSIGSYAAFTDVQIEYIPYTIGSYFTVKGDSWVTSQSIPYKDAVDEEVGISDSPKKIFVGALFRDVPYDPNNPHNYPLTTRSWYRQGRNEALGFKELANLAVYNHKYRRQWKVVGRFAGTKFSPVSDPTVIEPVSFHKHFTFPDATELNGVMFMLVPPLTIDYNQGEIDGTFVECLNTNNNTTILTKASVIDDIIGLINTTTADQWNAAGGAPAIGTSGYEPAASKPLTGTASDIWLYVPLSAVPSFTADANGKGNSPSITQISTSSGTLKLVTFKLGNDIVAGNRFILDLFGVQIIYTVAPQITYDDGNQTGDQHFFNYKFK